MADFRKLDVWREAHALMLDTHPVAVQMRGAVYLSLKSQIIRSVMSIPTNIVEGRAQKSDKEFNRYLGYAVASAAELEYHLIAARDIGAISYRKTDPLIERVIQVRKMLINLQKKA